MAPCILLFDEIGKALADVANSSQTDPDRLGCLDQTSGYASHRDEWPHQRCDAQNQPGEQLIKIGRKVVRHARRLLTPAPP